MQSLQGRAGGWCLLTLVAVATVFTAGRAWILKKSHTTHIPRAVEQVAESRTEEAPVPVVLESGRKYYPYSVIPGGVRSVEELRAAIRRDPVVAQHYAGFDLDHARVEHLAQPMIRFVSYRVGDEIYWTQRALHLRVGETIISDGVNCARGRCGNRVQIAVTKTFIPPFPEIPEETFDTPAMELPPTLLTLRPPIAPPPALPGLPGAPAVWAAMPRRFAVARQMPEIVLKQWMVLTTPMEVVVPEPGTFVIAGTGLVALLIGKRWRKRRPNG